MLIICGWDSSLAAIVSRGTARSIAATKAGFLTDGYISCRARMGGASSTSGVNVSSNPFVSTSHSNLHLHHFFRCCTHLMACACNRLACSYRATRTAMYLCRSPPSEDLEQRLAYVSLLLPIARPRSRSRAQCLFRQRSLVSGSWCAGQDRSVSVRVVLAPRSRIRLLDDDAKPASGLP